MEYFDRVERAAESLGATLADVPPVAVVLGSGLGAFADSLTDAATIPYNPVTIPRSAQPKLKLEFTEGQNLHLENATARPGEPTVARTFTRSPSAKDRISCAYSATPFTRQGS